MGITRTIVDTAQLASRWLRLELGARRHRKSSPKGRHLALFAWALPPNTNAGVFRPLSFLRYGGQMGWRIDAFRGEVPANQGQHGDELLSTVPQEVRLHEIRDARCESAYRLTPKIDGGFADALAFAAEAIDTLADDPPDIVLASGPPFLVFVAAMFVARHFGVPLVLDYRDEWSECPFDFVSAGGDDRAWERRCLRAADAVLFTTQSHLDHQLERFPELTSDKAFLVPNGWEADDFRVRSGPEREGPGLDGAPLTIAHVGNLAGHTPPDAFLQAAGELMSADSEWRRRIRLQFVGRRSPDANRALEAFPHGSSVELIDHVGKQEANRRMQEADILLLIATPDLERYLPGKLFDYIAAGRPILVFGSPGEASRVVDGLGVGALCEPGSGERLRETLDFLRSVREGRQPSIIQSWLDDHRRDRLARRAFEIIGSLI